MSEQTISAPENAQIVIRSHADLNLQGWEKQEIRAESDSRRSVTVQNNENNLTITCSDDCDLYVPLNSKLVVERVSGDAFMRNLKGGLVIQKVGGDLAIEQVGPLEILSTGGDCLVYAVGGPLNVQRIGGDLAGGQIQGPVSVASAGGDIDMQLAEFEISISGRGDVNVEVGASSGQKISLNASGDAILYLPKQQVNADLNLVCGGEIEISTVGMEDEFDHVYVGKLGSGGSRITVHAGGDIELTSRGWDNDDVQEAVADLEEHWAELIEKQAERLERHERHSHSEGIRFGADVVIDTNELTDRMNKKVAEKMRQAQARIDAAMKRIEERNHGFTFTIPSTPKVPAIPSDPAIPAIPPVPPVPPVPPIPPILGPRPTNLNPNMQRTAESQPPYPETSKVSDEERLMILKMLQEKRITAEEAEKLLEALDN